MSQVILEAWKMGAKFDAWNDHFQFDIWLQAFEQTRVRPGAFTPTVSVRSMKYFPGSTSTTTVRKKFLTEDYLWSLERQN